MKSYSRGNRYGGAGEQDPAIVVHMSICAENHVSKDALWSAVMDTASDLIKRWEND